jgi:acetyl esterase/lipase
MKRKLTILILCLGFSLSAAGAGEPKATFTRTEDVVYGRKFGTALTLDVFRPENPNGAAVLFLVSGGWVSNHTSISSNGGTYRAFLNRGYTVFAVLHGSQPRYIVPEIVDDIQRAARFVRHHALQYGIDPMRIGVTGASSGGHLSLMLGLIGGPGQIDAKDPVDRENSAVQAVACFCAPTDFDNWDRPGADWLGVGPIGEKYQDAWGPMAATPEGRRALSKAWSPIRFVRASMPPTLVIHGDADKTVPIYQAKTFEAAAHAAGGTYKLIVRPGAGHNWPGLPADRELLADWFDQYLKAPVVADH